MTTDTNKPSPVAEPASEPPHRLDSWATECSEPATDKDHLTVAPASAADGLPEPVAKIHSDGYWTEGKSFKEPLNFASMELYTADQMYEYARAAVETDRKNRGEA